MKYLLILITSLFTLSCSNDIVSEHDMNETDVRSNNPHYVLTESQIQYAGQLHNTILRESLTSLVITGNYEVDIRNSFANLNYGANTLALNYQDYYNSILTLRNNFDTDLLDNSLEGFVNKLQMVLTSNHYDNIIAIESLTTLASSELKEVELMKFKLCASVAKNSSYFWCDTAFGGSGEGTTFRNTIPELDDYIKAKGTSTSGIIAADVTGMYQSMATWALGTLLFSNPVTAGPYVFVLAAGAAWSSARA